MMMQWYLVIVDIERIASGELRVEIGNACRVRITWRQDLAVIIEIQEPP